MSSPHFVTDEEYLNLPEYPGRQELLDGELINCPPAMHRDSNRMKGLESLLDSVLDPERVWQYAGYRLKRGWLAPDLSVTWPDQPVDEWLLGSPMVAIEFASHGNTAEDMDCKVAAYLDEGAAEVWVIYPKTRTMIVFRKNETIRVTAEYRCEIVPVTIDLAAVIQ